MKDLEKSKYKKTLAELTKTVAQALTLIDVEMRKPSTLQRGKNIARICNVLEMANDSAMYSVLNYGWTKIGNIKKLESHG